MIFKLPEIQNEGIAAWLAMVDKIEEVPPGIPALAAVQVVEGKMTLMLRGDFNTWPDELQNNIISHECHHMVFEHHHRREDRDPNLWGLVTDAVLYHNACEDWQMTEAILNARLKEDEQKVSSSTFERIGIPPCRAEVGYDMLLNNKSDKIKVIHCGSSLLSKMDGSVATQQLMDKIMIEVGPHMQGASTGGGVPMAITGTIPSPPEWIRRVIPFLIEAVNRVNRGRSWRRFSRTGSDLLPGREATNAYEGQIFIDQSGSCDKYIPMFLAAVCSTPELAGTRVYTFDDQVRGPVPASDTAGVREILEASRGGTLISKAGKLRESGCPVVWLTDAESGDGLPKRHDAAEVWCVTGSASTPGRLRIQIDG